MRLMSILLNTRQQSEPLASLLLLCDLPCEEAVSR
jgi:hypothetical protein